MRMCRCGDVDLKMWNNVEMCKCGDVDVEVWRCGCGDV